MLVRNTDEDKGVKREARERERNARTKAFGIINKDMADLGKDIYREKDKAGRERDTLASAKAKVQIIAYKI